MPDFSLPGYPTPFGNRYVNITTHNGPLLYAAGGEALNASAFGWGSFDRVAGSVSFNANNTGNYSVQVRYPVGQAPATANNNISGKGNPIPTGSNSVVLVWLAANGTEAANNTNLTSEFVRLEMHGG